MATGNSGESKVATANCTDFAENKFCGCENPRNPRMPVEADVVVRSEVDVGLVADQGFRAGDAFMDAKERIGDVEKLGGLPNQADLAKPFKLRRLEPLGGGIDRLPGGTAR